MNKKERCMKCNHIIETNEPYWYCNKTNIRYCKYCGTLNIYKPLKKIIVKEKEVI